jgi:ABC-type transport system involved in cytochrome bd biosynthesis fused ATPase/permease subunit
VYLVEDPDNEVAGHTLAVMAGINTVTGGEVFIDDTKTQPNSIAQLTSYVGSRSSVLQGSILDNLCGFNPELSESALSFSKKLGLYDVLTQLPDGLETKLADLPTIPLSQSSIRLINLCFQLAKSTPLLFIDRPEIDLDIDTWPKLVSVLEDEVQKGRTVALVTHNPHFRQLASQVITVEANIDNERREPNE